GQDGKYDRGDAAFTAYCVSYVFCKKEGFDVSRFSFDRMPESFAGMEPQAGRNELTRVRNVSSDILENMNAKLEQQRDKASRQPER
ncbi:MAG: hypothetical protein QMB62_10960, partial [Oscillospiraceae bacterium]